MAQVFYFPGYQALSSSGTSLPGAKLSFFETGTTTAAAVYADAARTTTLSNPVVADAQGRFPQIYPDTGVIYRVRLSDSSNVQQWQEDGVCLQLFPRTAAEIAAGVTPVNYAYPPGSFLRYGMDPTGHTNSADALDDAISANCHVFDDYPGGGTYRFNDEVIPNKSNLRISGATRSGSGISGGTTFRLASTATGASILRWTTMVEGLMIEDICFETKNAATVSQQKALRFHEIRSSNISRCRFEGLGTAEGNTTAIQLDGLGTFSGSTDIERCYIDGHLYGIDMQGVCTTVRVLMTEIYGAPGVPGSVGIRIDDTCTGQVVMGCAFYGMRIGIRHEGGHIKQIGNYFENADIPYQWFDVDGTKKNQSIGNNILTGSPIFNDRGNSVVIDGPGFVCLGNAYADAIQGYRVGGVPVVGPRSVGWTAMTGTPNESSAFNVATVTLPQLAARVKALQDALTAHGLIGT